MFPVQPLPEATLDDQLALGRRVGAWLEEGRSVYAVGCTPLLAFNQADNHVRYGFFFRGLRGWLAEHEPGFRPERDGAMPDIVLVSRRLFPEATWLEQEYRRVPRGAFGRQGICPRKV